MTILSGGRATPSATAPAAPSGMVLIECRAPGSLTLRLGGRQVTLRGVGVSRGLTRTGRRVGSASGVTAVPIDFWHEWVAANPKSPLIKGSSAVLSVVRDEPAPHKAGALVPLGAGGGEGAPVAPAGGAGPSNSSQSTTIEGHTIVGPAKGGVDTAQASVRHAVPAKSDVGQ